jgi:hypothetical protein
MQPKEKAEELLRSFSFLRYDQKNGTKIKGNASIELKSAQKQCDEIIKSIDYQWEVNYWKQVKQEIENYKP